MEEQTKEKKPIHENQGRIIMFTGKECDHCHENLPDVEHVEKEHGVEFHKLEVWHDAQNAAFLEQIDRDENGDVWCGGIPFYYNEKTGRKLCGPQKKEKLAALVKGEDAPKKA